MAKTEPVGPVLSPLKWRRFRVAVGLFALMFGALTLLSGGTVLFGSEQFSQMAGKVVPWVLWFNFLAGFAYIAAGAGLIANKKWSMLLAGIISVATLVVGIFFAFHVINGAPFEPRTIGALALRLGVWIAIYLFARSLFRAKDA